MSNSTHDLGWPCPKADVDPDVADPDVANGFPTKVLSIMQSVHVQMLLNIHRLSKINDLPL